MDLVLFLLFTFLPFAIAISGYILKSLLTTATGSMFMIMWGSYIIQQNPKIEVSYAYNSVSNTFYSYSVDIPYMPYSMLIYVLLGVFLLLSILLMYYRAE
ncbi:MAG: hypothetical protein QXE05_04835 [Nitrososphaeria archaeon]